MSRGKIDPPNLDDRNWQDIVNQAKALIPKYAPEWTDHNTSDLGITLIELFAWIVESMIYRLNRVPEKNLIAFFNLLGITRDPATPASTYLTYQSNTSVTVPKGSQAATLQTETDTAIVFETDEELRILPFNLVQALAITNNQGTNVTNDLIAKPLAGANFTIAADDTLLLVLGFDAASTETINLLLSLSQPVAKVKQEEEEEQLAITSTWHYSVGDTTPDSWTEIPSEDTSDATEGLQTNGTVALKVPNDWTEQNPEDWSGITLTSESTSSFWISIRLQNTTDNEQKLGIEHILFNSVKATNALTITQPELLGISNGEPFQSLELQNRPLFKQPGVNNPYSHLVIQVREPLSEGSFTNWEPWRQADEFPPGEGNYFRLNPVTGTINFGNYHPTLSPDGHGSIPPNQSEIQALTYRYVVGGVKGNVAHSSIRIIRTLVPGVIGVINPAAATGGSDEESIAETQRRAPELLRNRYRAVTVEDYEYLAREASTDIQKVRCLPPRLFTEDDDLSSGVEIGTPWTYGGLNRSTSSVNVIIIPAAPVANPRPLPSQDLIQEVFNYLEVRRPVATQLNVTYPRYIPISVRVNIGVWRSAIQNNLTNITQLEAEVEEKIKLFLHPLWGGLEGNGWQIGQEIAIAELFKVIQPATEIGFISSLKIAAVLPGEPNERPYDFIKESELEAPDSEWHVWLPVADYEIICSHTKHLVNADPVNN